MSLTQKVKDQLAESKAQRLVHEGKFDEALEHIKAISSPDRQREFTCLQLFGLASRLAAADGLSEIHITQDRQEYDRFQALVGTGGSKYMLYSNPETGLMEAGCAELVKAYVSSANPLLHYFLILPDK